VINNALNNRQHFITIKHTHEKLKERFFSLFERAPVGIYYYNEKLELQDLNMQFADMNKEKNKEALMGLSLYDMVDDKAILLAHEQVFKEKTGNYRGPLQTLSKKKENIYVDLSTVPMLNSEGEVAGGITIVNDITS
jgi:PAS domain-containing protein